MKSLNSFKRRSVLISLIITIATVIVLVFLYMSTEQKTSVTVGQKSSTIEKINIAPPSESDILVGNSNAKYKVLIYTDYECPYCREVDAAIPGWISEFGSTTIAFYIRHFPLTQIHPRALDFAKNVECVKRQLGDAVAFNFGKYIYDKRNLSTREILSDYFKDSPSSTAENIVRCSEDKEVASFIEKTSYEALLNNLKGTPSFAIFDSRKNEYVIKAQGGAAAPYYRYFKVFIQTMGGS